VVNFAILSLSLAHLTTRLWLLQDVSSIVGGLNRFPFNPAVQQSGLECLLELQTLEVIEAGGIDVAFAAIRNHRSHPVHEIGSRRKVPARTRPEPKTLLF
jgi:hypothetical protein